MTCSLHITGSKQFGGADRFYCRLVCSLNACGHTAVAVNRPDSPVRTALDGMVEQIHVPMHNVWDVFSALNIRRIVRKTRVPIVQTYMGRATRLTRLPPGRETIHVARLGGYYKIRGYYEHADAWVGNTRGVCDYLVRNGLPTDRVYLIGNFVRIEPTTPAKDLIELRQSLNIPNEAVVIFSLARFIRIKGIDILLAAFARLPRAIHGRPLYLVVAGDGPLCKQLQLEAARLEVTARLRWVGWQNDPGSYYDLADVFVCPSRHETLGNVILEAWAHHLPIIATDTPGALELIKDGENGLLTPCNDTQALAQRLLELVEGGSETWQTMAQRGTQTLLRNHSQEAVVGAYLSMYDELLNN